MRTKDHNKKVLISSILIFSSLIGAAQDTTKVDYIKVLNLDSTDYNPEGFFKILEDRYAPLGEIEELSCVIGDRYYDVEKICIRYVEFPFRWICYTPFEIEQQLKIKK